MSDFTKFTHILAVDEKTLRDLTTMEPHNATAVVRLWGSYVDWIPIPRPEDDKKVCSVWHPGSVIEFFSFFLARRGISTMQSAIKGLFG